MRQGTSSVSATSTAIRRMIKDTDGDSFEAMRSLEQNLTFQAAEKEFVLRDLAFGVSQMKTLGILNKDGIYTNLGLLLSEQCAHTVKAAVFEGTNQSIFRDRQEFTGSLLQQMNEVYEYIDRRNQVHSTFDKLRRIDTRDYPEVAIREALLNSLVHRDYSFSASTLISVYDDRIEFTSIGGLSAGVSLDDIMLGLSVCRNPKLANVFYRLELIEAYGTGMKKIMGVYENSNKKPVIETTDNAFKIILPNLNEDVGSLPVADAGSEAERQVLEFIQKNGSISRKETETAVNLKQTAAGRLLSKMIQKKLIVQIGQGKNTKYRLP